MNLNPKSDSVYSNNTVSCFYVIGDWCVIIPHWYLKLTFTVKVWVLIIKNSWWHNHFSFLFDVQPSGLPDIEELAYNKANGSAVSSKLSADSISLLFVSVLRHSYK